MSSENYDELGSQVSAPHDDLSDIRLETVYDEDSGEYTMMDPEAEDIVTHWITAEDESSIYDLEETV